MLDVLERGDISFFYRPRVRPADREVQVPGVQAFFVILAPAGGDARRVRIGRKRLPAVGDRFWAEVERVGSVTRVLADQLEDEEYSTKTRGARIQPGARPIAQGEYEIARHDDHVHLSFHVEQVEPDVPEEVAVPSEASYLILFEGERTWTADGSPSQIDREGAEIVLIGTAELA